MALITVDDVAEVLGKTYTEAEETVITSTFIPAAEKELIQQLGYTFGTNAGVRYYDAIPVSKYGRVKDYLLFLDTYASSITKVEVSDVEIEAADYVTLGDLPDGPIWGIKLRNTAQTNWYSWSDDPLEAIKITANWAYSATLPEDVKIALCHMVDFLYKTRGGKWSQLHSSWKYMLKNYDPFGNF